MFEFTPFAVLAFVLTAVPTFAQTGDTLDPDSGRAAGEYNLGKKGLAIGGYDPVAYRPEGGGAPAKGKSSLAVSFQGVTYRFANEQNRRAFLEDPQRYEPHYGGWCAWAMNKGDKVEVDPESFLVEEDRLLLFYDGWFNDTRKQWLEKGGARLRPKADLNWHELSGERAAELPPNVWGKEVGLDGLDPVLHTADELTLGMPELRTRLGGVLYRFTSAENRIAFLASPSRFLPLFGGHGGTALAEGDLTKGDPRVYVRQNGRAVLFRDEAGREAWRAEAAKATRAAEAWTNLLKKREVTR